MPRQRTTVLLLTLALVFAARLAVGDDAAKYRSHPPMRPLAVANNRPLPDGSIYFVDPVRGDDSNDGGRDKPYRTIQRGVENLKAGDTLCLRGGIYFERVVVQVKGTADKPITIRSYPGELATIDGGYRKFQLTPQTAWRPCPGGVEGEFQSVKTYPELGDGGGTQLLGNFADSMVPLHGYRFLEDLRSNNEYFSKIAAGKTEAGSGVYCGPGVYYHPQTKRIHVRLAHTTQKALGENNYRGLQDPRMLSLVIAGSVGGSPLTIADSQYIKVQDIVVRGSRGPAISISGCSNIQFEGTTAYGGSSAFGVSGTAGLRLWNCACRGIAAPWTYRGSLKYRAIEARIFSASGWDPGVVGNRDFELAYSEFTDCVDGVFLGNVRNVKFHHNLLDNVSDDGLFITATTGYDGKTPGGNLHVYQNVLSRCLTTFAFGVGHGRQKMTPDGRQTGAGVSIYRNVFDFRKPVYYTQPAEDETEMQSFGRVAGDHGSPLWEPMAIYQNTVLSRGTPFRGYYAAGWGGHLGGGSSRWIFNNAFIHVDGTPGAQLPPVIPPPDPAELARQAKLAKANKPSPEEDELSKLLDDSPDKKKKKENAKFAGDTNPNELAKLKKTLNRKPPPVLPSHFHTDGNLHWSYDTPPANSLFDRFRNSPDFETSKRLYKPGWTTNDVVADPRLKNYPAPGNQAADLRLSSGSAAIDAGVALPKGWPDPLRGADRNKPDIGAFPLDAKPWRVGVNGRLDAFGEQATDTVAGVQPPAQFPSQMPIVAPATKYKPAAIVAGYPARDEKLLRYAIQRHGIPCEVLSRTWLDTKQYQDYSLVALVGNLVRAKIEPRQYDKQDLARLEAFVSGGGTLLVTRGATTVFGSPEGRELLEEWIGSHRAKADSYRILLADHAWVKHLAAGRSRAWLARGAEPLRAQRGEIVIGSKTGLATLYRRKIGKGQLIYVGWEIAASLPSGRRASTVQQEADYEEQMQILVNIVRELYPIADESP